MAKYLVELRERPDYAHPRPEPVEIEALKVEGWSEDYAFLESGDHVVAVFPRELVASVTMIEDDE